MYKILRKADGWVTDEQGNILVEDEETATQLWIPNNIVAFNDQNQPYIKDVNENEGLHHQEGPALEISYIDSDEHAEREDAASEGESNIKKIEKRTWTIESTTALINAVEPRYEDLFNVNKRKGFWNVVSEIMISQGFNWDAKSCSKKWDNLLRIYKNVKENKTKTGKGPTRFQFFDHLDEILGNLPSVSSPHSVDVNQIHNNNNTELDNNNASSESSCSSPTPILTSGTESAKKRKGSITMEYINLKKKHYEEQEMKRSDKDKYLKELLKLKKEKNDLLRRKVVALEKLANISNTIE